MKRHFLTILLFAILLCLSGCDKQEGKHAISDDSTNSSILTVPKEADKPKYPSEQPSADESVSFDRLPDNQTDSSERRAIWISYLELQDLLSEDQEESQENMQRVFDNVADLGLNTVIVQVRPFADAIYPSRYFPWSHIITGTQGKDPGYDPLAMMISSAKKRGLRFEAWVNPYRVKTTTTPLTDESVLFEFLEKQEDYVITTDGKSGTEMLDQALYLNPAREENQTLIVNGVKELVENYDIDAIHFDDYFYPTTDSNFDAKAFAESATELTLDAWRRQNINTLVRQVYETIKSVDQNVEFGISPQGNIDIDYNQQYADVKTWMENDGYLDYIMPQIYYGFDNNLAFDDTLQSWFNLSKQGNANLYVGLAAYKIGKEDQWAGEAGKDEWVTKSGDILKRQIEYCRGLENNGCKGFSLYSYNSLFQPDDSVKKMVENEMKNLKAILN